MSHHTIYLSCVIVTGWILSPKNIYGSPNLLSLRMWTYLEIKLLQMKFGKWKWGPTGIGRVLIQCDWHPLKRHYWKERWSCDNRCRDWKMPLPKTKRICFIIDSSIEISEGVQYLDFRFLVSKSVEQCISCFKPPSLWYFIMAALGN